MHALCAWAACGFNPKFKHVKANLPDIFENYSKCARNRGYPCT